MRICSKDSRHKNFLVSAIERHDWVVNEDGEFLEDKGCYDAAVADGCEWTCEECGSHSIFVTSVSEFSEREAKERLLHLRTLCEGLVKAHGNYNNLLRDEFVGKIQESILQLYGE